MLIASSGRYQLNAARLNLSTCTALDRTGNSEPANEEVDCGQTTACLETLEVERLDIAVAGLNGGLETFGMGHASTELGQSCQEGSPGEGEGESGASCVESECSCDDGNEG